MKSTTMQRFLFWQLLQWAMMCWFPCVAQSQSFSISSGAVKPGSPTENTWFVDPSTKKAWLYKAGKWSPMASHCTDAKICRDYMMLTIDHSRVEVWDTTANRIIPYGEKVTCFPGLLVMEGKERFLAIDTTEEILTFLDKNRCPAGILEVVGNDSGFCVPLLKVGMYNYMGQCQYLKTWGFLTIYGVWLIEPKFDAPFRFQNGFAEVIYYGQKRKINEKGGFVE